MKTTTTQSEFPLDDERIEPDPEEFKADEATRDFDETDRDQEPLSAREQDAFGDAYIARRLR